MSNHRSKPNTARYETTKPKTAAKAPSAILIVHTRFQKWFASKYLAKAERVFEEMMLGKLPRSKMAFPIRVASLGDLTQFLKRADGKLIHKSTNDLWSYSKDADGNFLVERLFDDEGEPLKG